MNITKLKYTKTGKRISVFVDNEFKFAVDDSLVIKYNLYEGKDITKGELGTLKKEDVTKQYLHKAVSYISRRPRSRKEIEIYLKKKLEKKDYNALDHVLNKLKEDDYINDEKFASWWIKNRISCKPRGQYRLGAELRKKGIDKDIIDEKLSELLTREKEIEMARELYKKKRRRYGKDLTLKEKKRIIDFLFRKGFKYNIIKKVIN